MNELLHRPGPALAADASAADDEVQITQKASARFNRYGVATFSLNLTPFGRRLLAKAAKLGRSLPVTIRFIVKNGGTRQEVQRLIQLLKSKRSSH